MTTYEQKKSEVQSLLYELNSLMEANTLSPELKKKVQATIEHAKSLKASDAVSYVRNQCAEVDKALEQFKKATP